TKTLHRSGREGRQGNRRELSKYSGATKIGAPFFFVAFRSACLVFGGKEVSRSPAKNRPTTRAWRTGRRTQPFPCAGRVARAAPPGSRNWRRSVALRDRDRPPAQPTAKLPLARATRPR